MTDRSNLLDSTPVIDLKSISKKNNYDETHLSSFGFLYTLKPTKTPLTGLMCSSPGSMYLQIVPSRNPGKTYIRNDSMENMLFEMQLFYGKMLYL